MNDCDKGQEDGMHREQDIVQLHRVDATWMQLQVLILFIFDLRILKKVEVGQVI